MHRGRGSTVGFARSAAVAAALAWAFASPSAVAHDGPVARTPVAAAVGDAGAEVAFRALSLLGVGYRFGGNTPEAGLDCSGLVRLVFNETLGLPLPRRSEEISRVGASINPTELQPGDLVFFNTLRRAFSHVGIYIGDNRFVHAPSSGGSIRVENLGADYWTRRFDGARRVLTQDLLAAATLNPVAASTTRMMQQAAAEPLGPAAGTAAQPAGSTWTGTTIALADASGAPERSVPPTAPSGAASPRSAAAEAGSARAAAASIPGERRTAAARSQAARAATVAYRPAASSASRPRPATVRAAGVTAGQRAPIRFRMGELDFD
jgi:hypothetical protein